MQLVLMSKIARIVKGGKICTKCRTTQPLSNFAYRANSSDKLQYACKGCKAQYHKDTIITQEMRERKKIIRKKFDTSEKGKLAKRRQDEKYRKTANGLQCKHKANQKYSKTEHGKVVCAKKEKKHMQTEKGQATHIRARHKRRQRERDTPISTLTAKEWNTIKEGYGYKCAYCREAKILTMDHVIPLSKGGVHTRDNVVPACRSCNSIKQNRTDIKPTVGILFLEWE